MLSLVGEDRWTHRGRRWIFVSFCDNPIFRFIETRRVRSSYRGQQHSQQLSSPPDDTAYTSWHIWEGSEGAKVTDQTIPWFDTWSSTQTFIIGGWYPGCIYIISPSRCCTKSHSSERKVIRCSVCGDYRDLSTQHLAVNWKNCTQWCWKQTDERIWLPARWSLRDAVAEKVEGETVQRQLEGLWVNASSLGTQRPFLPQSGTD